MITQVADTEYKYKYQGQERQDELGLNWDSFKYRNYDPAIGRFMSVDPLASKYPYNSTYAFQENKMGLGRELEGKELELFNWLVENAVDNPDGISAQILNTANNGIKWVDDNVVAEANVKGTVGVQAGIKLNSVVKVEAGVLTTEIGEAGLSTEKGAYAENGDGKNHNFVGAKVKLLSNKLSIGGKVDYVYDGFPEEGDDLGYYFTESEGDFQWGANVGPNINGPGIKDDYDFLGAKTSVIAETGSEDCNCIDLSIGLKLVIGLDVNIKIGIK